MADDEKLDRMIYQTDETRQKILDAAEKMFIEKGLFDTKMKDLAEEIGISRTSLYRYYRDKLDLSLSITASLLRNITNNKEIQKEADALPDGISRVEYLLKKYWLSPDQNDSYRFLAEFDAYYSGARIPAGLWEKMGEALQPIRIAPLRQYIKEGMEDGSIRRNLNANLVMETLNNAVRSLHQRLLLRGNILVDVSQEDLDKIMDEYLQILMNGIRNV